MSVLQVSNLHIAFGNVEVVRGVSFSLEKGETLGIVGESGCGKTVTGLAITRLLPPNGKITAGSVLFEGKELTTLPEHEMRKIRGGDIAMVFQDPFTSLNPAMRVGDQIAEAIVLHQEKSWSEARKQAVQELRAVKVPAPESTANKYPHQLSGGQRQRVMIAIAFACRPKILVADEPTTALDVTLQAQILTLLKELQEKYGTAVILISHDIGVVGTVANRIAVYYAGKIVEMGSSENVLRFPKHPYTQGLLGSLPSGKERLASIPGQPPDMANLEKGCSFAPRCSYRFSPCEIEPDLIPPDSPHRAACWLLDPAAAKGKVATK